MFRVRTLADAEGAEFITMAQAAQLIQVGLRTLEKWCRQGRLRRYGEGKLYRVRRSEVLALFETPKEVEPSKPDAEAVAASILRRVGG